MLPNQFPAWSDGTSGWDQVTYYPTIRLADIDGDGQAELLARGPGGILVNHFDTDTGVWIMKNPGPALSDINGWNQSYRYLSLRYTDIDGDGQAELLARASDEERADPEWLHAETALAARRACRRVFGVRPVIVPVVV